MKRNMKKILAVLLIVAMAFGWYATIFGVGESEPLKDKVQLGLDIKGGVYVVLEAKTDLEGEELAALMNQTKEVIGKRVDQMGISNADVRVEGTKRIRVELPGAKNAEEAISQIGKTAQLQFLLADGGFVLDGGDVKNATIGQSQEGGYAVSLEFKADGAKAFEEATKKALSGTVQSIVSDGQGGTLSNKAILIMLDSQIISAPTVNEVISGGQCEITGDFTKEEATQLAALIRGGALPAPLEEVSSSVQSAKIGLDAFNNSVKAAAIGLAIIMIVMLIGYRIMGLAADIALLMYVLIDLAILGLLGNVLTLPGIAGLILSIGMAVDANVIIFTRIKEEIAKGKSPRVAVGTGFKRAMSTVVDSQVTTLIAAVILYQVGTSAVKGFALTLLIGILVSLLTAVVVTKLYLEIFAESKKFSQHKFFGIKEDGTISFAVKKEFKFIEKRKLYYTVSAVILVVGLAFGLIRGFNYGIDFTGGTMVQMDMGTKIEMEKVDKILEKHNVDAEVVYAGEDNTEIIIRTVEALENTERSAIIKDIQSEFKLKDDSVLAQELFGPTVGKEIKTNAIIAVLLSAIGMLIYIRLRFKEWKFGAAALAGVLHDVLIMISFYAIFNITVNNPFIAGILTVVGYSINDTIVIFDRIRENGHFMKLHEKEMVDLSINQTLSRSIITSFTTLVVMVPLYIMTSDAVREFVLPLMVGVIVGCMSSIFISSPLYYDLVQRDHKSAYQKQMEAQKRKKRKKYVGGVKKDKKDAK